VYGVATSGNSVYLIVKMGGNRMIQTFKAKTNIEKLEMFLKKDNFDVAYRFAKNEKFSEEVLAEISRYYGDFFYKKVYNTLNSIEYVQGSCREV
jgi:hypothetical protein